MLAGGVVGKSMAARIGTSPVSTPFDQAWVLLKNEDDEFKQAAYGTWHEDDWADKMPEGFDFDALDAEDYDEEIHREYPTGQVGYSPGMKDLRRSYLGDDDSFRDLIDNPTRDPIIVVRDKNGEEHIISGHHRMAANIEAERPHLPALVLNMMRKMLS